MNLDTDIDYLRSQHQTLEQQIDAELKRPSPDTLRLTELKRQKLRIKEQLVRMAEVQA